MPNVLVVEPNARIATGLQNAVERFARVDREHSFAAAKKRLSSTPFDFLIANLRLGDFNGLHLVYLNAIRAAPPRAIVYTETRDPSLAREVQRAGAFYETAECLPITLVAYLTGMLPPADRRDAALPDRRASTRGGRRCWDRHLLGGTA